MIQFAFKLLILRIRSFFSINKTTPSVLKTQQFTETLTQSELDNLAPLVQPTSVKPSYNPPKSYSKKRDTKGRYVRS